MQKSMEGRKNKIRLAKYIICAAIKNSLLFKGSLALNIITIFISELSGAVCLFAMITSFQGIKGISSEQFCFIYFFSHLCWGLSRMFLYNLRYIGSFIMDGTLDKILILPVNTMAYICMYCFDLSDAGAFISSIVLFLLFKNCYGIIWTLPHIFLLILGVIGGAAIISGILMIVSTIAYFSIEWKAVDNMFNSFVTILWYPVTIFNSMVQAVLYTFVPLAYVAYVPSLIIFNGVGGYTAMLLKLVVYVAGSIGFMLIAYQFWNKERKNYQSTG